MLFSASFAFPAVKYFALMIKLIFFASPAVKSSFIIQSFLAINPSTSLLFFASFAFPAVKNLALYLILFFSASSAVEYLALNLILFFPASLALKSSFIIQLFLAINPSSSLLFSASSAPPALKSSFIIQLFLAINPSSSLRPFALLCVPRGKIFCS